MLRDESRRSMIVGIGADLCSIDRIAASLDRFGDAFLARIFTDAERAYADGAEANRAARYAKRFAAKEACAKALGTGFRDGLAFSHIEVLRDALGRPTLGLHGLAADRAAALLPPGHRLDAHLSLTDDHPWAQAFVVLAARPV